MGDDATCVWGMSEQDRTEWNARAESAGFATVKQQERLTRIYDALRSALEGAGYRMIEQVDRERKAISHHGTFTISQDDHRVQFSQGGAVGFNWKYDGTVVTFTPVGLKHDMTAIIADALGRIA